MIAIIVCASGKTVTKMLNLNLIVGTCILFVCSYALPYPAIPSLRIVGGRDAADHVAPYMVYIQQRLPNRTDGTCAGSLISNNYVLTAAHCLDGMKGYGALLGVNDLNKVGDPGAEVRVNGTWQIHPQYNARTTSNDIAIMKLPKPVQYSSVIQPVKLPSKSESTQTYEGRTVSVYGWGTITGNTLPTKLQTADLTVSNLASCKTAYIPYRQPVSDKQLCTSGAPGQGVCDGDSGGPAMLNGVQVGITSFVTTCGGRVPAVHVNVARYLDWIEANSDVVIN